MIMLSGAALRICSLVAVIVAVPLAAVADPASGEKIYQDGVLSSGAPLIGRVAGGSVMRRGVAACARCHRASGYGLSEAEAITPMITGPVLFEELMPRRADLLRSLYQVNRSAVAIAAARTPRYRPAYNRSTLAAAIRMGRDPTGRVLGALMPRFSISDTDMDHLIDYLFGLGRKQPAGVGPSTIEFATIVAGDVGSSRVKAMTDVIDAFVRRRNFDTAVLIGNRGKFPYGKDEYVSARRNWVVHAWQLTGDAETWGAQLRRLYQANPVFAVIGGVSAGEWKPVHGFCEAERLPCIFPHVVPTAVMSPNRYNLYFSKSLRVEAEVLAGWLAVEARKDGKKPKVVQVHRGTRRQRAMASAFRSKLEGEGRHAIVDVAVERPGPIEPAFWTRLYDRHAPDALLLWLSADDVSALRLSASAIPDSVELYLSGGFLETSGFAAWERLPARVKLTFPFAIPGKEVPRIHRIRAWLRSRKIARRHERLQLNTYFALSITSHALSHIVDHFSRDYLIESIEHEAENKLNPGTYPHLGLGPGQRYASKGYFLVSLQAAKSGARFKPLSGWIVP